MRYALLSLLMLCSAPAVARTAEQTARLGQTVRVGALAVRPIAVVEDSRCPRDVTCVWRGRLRLSAMAGHKRVMIDDGVPLAVRGGHLTLVEVTPVGGHGEKVAAERYRFRFRFER
jgi:hypothetical protein